MGGSFAFLSCALGLFRIYNFWNQPIKWPVGHFMVISTQHTTKTKGPMRIGITCYPTYGGSGVVATELGIELAALGHEIHFISYAPPIRMPSAAERIFFHEVEVTTYPLFDHPPYTLALATRMYEVAEEASLDLMHVHYAIPHSVSALLARMMAAPKKLPFIT